LQDVHEINAFQAGNVCLSVRMIQIESRWTGFDEILVWKLCHFLLYKKLLHQRFVFSENHTSLYGPIASGASVDPTLQVCWHAVLVLSILGDCKARF
jgi:hypothetical protein